MAKGTLSKDAILRLKLDGFGAAGKQIGELRGAFDRAAASTLQLAMGAKRATDTITAGFGASLPAVLAVPDAMQEVGAQADEAADALDKAAQATESVGDAAPPAANAHETAADRVKGAWTKASSAFSSVVTAIDKIATAGGALMDILGRGADVAGVATAFAELSGGAERSAVSIEQLKTATQGAVSDMQLMAGANLIAASGVQLATAQFAELSEAAITLGSAVGVSAAESYARLTQALAKAEPSLVKELGLSIDVTQALEAAAAARGVAVAELDQQSKAQALANAVLEQARTRMGELGGAAVGAANPIERLQVQWTNLTDRFAMMIAQNPQILGAFEAISNAAIALAAALAPVVNAVATVVSLPIQAVGAIVGGIAGVFGGDSASPSASFGSAPAAAAASSTSSAPAPALALQARAAFDSLGHDLQVAARESGRALSRRVQMGGL